MGAALARLLVGHGKDVGWVSAGRSVSTGSRAAEAGLLNLSSFGRFKDARAVVVSVCPPHAAVDVAQQMRGYRGLYVDVNAVSPGTAQRIGEIIREGGGSCVDGGIIGPPPDRPGTTRLYLSGGVADSVAALFFGSHLDAKVIGPELGAASALKMTYAAWTKGTRSRSSSTSMLADNLCGSAPIMTDPPRLLHLEP